MKFVRVYIEGTEKGKSVENRLASEFGSGWRTLFAFTGRKWVKLLDWKTLRVARVLLRDWEQLCPKEITREDGYRRRKVYDTIRERVMLADRNPTAFERMAMELEW